MKKKRRRQQPRRAIGPSTLCVHGGETQANPYHALTTPIVDSSNYEFGSTKEILNSFEGKTQHKDYARYTNDTTHAAEDKLAKIEGAGACILLSSGMSAIDTVIMAFLKSGAHVVVLSRGYRRTLQCIEFLKKFGVPDPTEVEAGDYAALEAAIRPNTSIIFAETPTNPYLRICDVARVAEIRDRHPWTKLIIDSTFATPINQRPLAHGADLVIHSGTKYLAGHNNVLAGAVLGTARMIDALRGTLRDSRGGILDPYSAGRFIVGLEALALRVARHNENGLAVATWLDTHPAIEKVYYPGLPSHPDHDIARKQMSGFGGVVTFLIKGNSNEGMKVVDAIRLAKRAASFGGVKTLIQQPAVMSYAKLTPKEREKIGIHDNLIRFSCGIEDKEDIIADLDQALAEIAP